MKHTLLAGSLLIALTNTIFYCVYGYQAATAWVWLASIFLGGLYFSKIGEVTQPIDFDKWDFYCLGTLLIFFLPPYLYSLYSAPWQINTDEIVIMNTERFLTSGVNPDLFGLSDYFNFPSFIFIIYGWIGKWIGGIDLSTMRTVSSLIGVLIVLFSYLFFRQLFSKKHLALVGSFIMGSSHALLGISRMAMRDNSALLFAVASLWCFVYGFKNKSPLMSYLGGAVSGLAFYSYLPGRITICLWFFFLFYCFVYFRKKEGAYRFSTVYKLGIISLVGFFLVVSPLTVSTIKSHLNESSDQYYRSQLLIYPEGRVEQRKWVNAETIEEGVKANIISGLTLFNNTVHDYSYIYPNYGNGFVDPFSGVLIWIGFFVLIFRKPKAPTDLLILGSFISLFFLFVFIINKTPNYTRLLVILPYCVFLITTGLAWVSNKIVKCLGKEEGTESRIFPILLALGLMVIIFWNSMIYKEFIDIGVENGNDVGSTGRYIHARAEVNPYSFYLAANEDYLYYYWGEPYLWSDWIGFFTQEFQDAAIINPSELDIASLNVPFTLFMSKALYTRASQDLINKYPQHQLHKIVPDGSLLAFEVVH